MDIIFIIFLLVALAVGIFAAETDNFIFTTATIIATFTGLELFFAVPVWATIVANPTTLILFVFIYTAIGAAYTAIWRWPEFLKENSDNIHKQYDRYTKSNEDATLDNFLQSNVYNTYSASNRKAHLANWVLAWPLSLLWELSRKPVVWLWNNIYTILGNLFDRIAKRVTKNILEK